jgi:hypothetical protein
LDAETLGNQHGLQCPKCKKGDELAIEVLRWATLLPDGTEDEGGDTEWDDPSRAKCNDCGWEGQVKDLIVIELDDEEGSWTNHFYHCNTQWDDVWSCQCNDECPVCGHEIEPYASTDNDSGELQIHNQVVSDMADNKTPCCISCGNAVCTEHNQPAH